MYTNKNCGCKGIRTCLLCEKECDILKDSQVIEQVPYVYTYCDECNLCWPNDEVAASCCDFPLYLGKLTLVPEFISEEEEALAISSIDRIPWMPSQSGRRKQDFGPKVNFKKKKVKIGEFKGFPKFTESVLEKLKDIPELSDFQPVELCHLEYSLERGSCIDPHVDDFWLWGERLVTVNLGSSTVLTLVPCSENTCECLEESRVCFQPYTSFNEHKGEKKVCNHRFLDTSAKNSFRFPANDVVGSKNGENVKRSESSVSTVKDSVVASVTVATNKINSLVLQLDVNQSHNKSFEVSDDNVNDSSLNSSEILDSHANEIEDVKTNRCDQQDTDAIPAAIKHKCFFPHCLSTHDNRMSTMCSVFRSGENCSKICVRIALPPRSLLVLAGCARYNWFHEIKRKDVASRRLAMTFRELTSEFLDGGKQSQVGKDLLLIANNFYDLE